ncbi:MAG: glycosyltransferase family protein [Burkholderiales bacterium]|nr:glycosyltransferase family protein [Burkholderiales bacterium]
MRVFERIRRGTAARSGTPRSPAVPQADVAAPSSTAAGSSHCLAGDRLLAQGLAERACGEYQAAIEAGDDCARAHLGQSRAYIALGRIDEAFDSLEVASALNPECVATLQCLAALRRDSGAVAEAIALLERAVALQPMRSDLHCELALALNRAGRVAAAVQAYRTAIALNPRAAAAHINLGLVHLQQLGEAREAEAHFRAALAVDATRVEALANLGLALHDQGRHVEVFELYRHALRQHADHTELRWNQALARLSLGDYAQGWPDYELRFSRPGGRKLGRFPYPDWDGDTLREGGLLVLAEQGLGDEIMFASCLEDLRAVAHRVVVECSPRLAPLFARSFGGMHVHGVERQAALDWLDAYPDLVAKTAIGSLPARSRNDLTSFPRHQGYLRADPKAVAAYRARLDALGGSVRVGLSWRGGTDKTRSMLRSLDLASLRPFFDIAQARFVCLQHGLHEAERRALSGYGVAVWDEIPSDLDATAALISALDVVVTVANTNAHLAGALGRPAWVLLNACPEWRWWQSGERSPWYPSLTLLRAERCHPLDATIGPVAEWLSALRA